MIKTRFSIDEVFTREFHVYFLEDVLLFPDWHVRAVKSLHLEKRIGENRVLKTMDGDHVLQVLLPVAITYSVPITTGSLDGAKQKEIKYFWFDAPIVNE